MRPSSQHRYHQPQQSHPHSYSKPPPHDHRPPTNNAVFDHIARRDFEASRAPRPGSSRRSSSRDRSDSNSHRSESTRRHHRNLSSHSSHRNSAAMTATASVMADGASSRSQATSGHPLQSVSSRRRTTITSPSGHWAMGKTIGAGSMGKVKLAKNVETGEQVIKLAPCRVVRVVNTFNANTTRSLLKSYLDNHLMSIGIEKQSAQTAQRRFEPLVRLPLLA